MKILVLSDSHGNVNNMAQAVEHESPHMILHLGDCWRDAERLHARFPEIPLHQVPGNCDFQPAEPLEQILFLDDLRVLICHGHTYGVKQSMLSAGFAAEEKKVTLLPLEPGNFAIFFPEEGHMPGCGNKSSVVKIVVKIHKSLLNF